MKTIKEANSIYNSLILFYKIKIYNAIKKFGGRKALSRKLKKNPTYITISLKRGTLPTLKEIAERVSKLK